MKTFVTPLIILSVVSVLTGCGTTKSKPVAEPHSSPASPTAILPTTPPSKTPGSPPEPKTVSAATAASTVMTAIDFKNTEVGWMAGSGKIWMTTDGGHQWIQAYDHGTANLQSIQFPNAKTGFVYSYHTILTTTNGGESWHIQYHGTSPIVSLSMTSSQNGYAVLGTPSSPSGPGGPGDSLYVTTDGGRHWHSQPTPFHPLAVAFANPKEGWVVGNQHIWRTTDGGKEWMPVYIFGDTIPLAATIRIAGQHIYVLLPGESSMSQTSYTLLEESPSQSWHVVLAKSTAGSGPAPDAPANAPEGPELAPGPLAAVAGGNAFFAGESSAMNLGVTAIWSTSDGGNQWTKNPILYGINGSPGQNALSFINSQKGWLVSGQANTQVFATTNGGRTWQQIFPAPAPVRGASFVNPSLGFGLGLPGHPNAVVQTQNGGRLWSLESTLATGNTWQNDMPSPTGPAIVYTNSKNGWLVRDQHLWHTNNGGYGWSAVTLPSWTTSDPLEAISFVGLDGVVGSPYSRTCWWTVNGGKTWNWDQHESSAQALTDMNRLITAESQNVHQIVWSAGSKGPLEWLVFPDNTWAFSVDQGRHWIIRPVPGNIAGGLIGALSFVNAHDGWMESSTGQLYYTTDGGQNWRMQP